MKLLLITLALATTAFADRALTLTWEKYPVKSLIVIYEKLPDGTKKELGSVPVSPEAPPEELEVTVREGPVELYAIARDPSGLESDPSETLRVPAKLPTPGKPRLVVEVKVTVNQ